MKPAEDDLLREEIPLDKTGKYIYETANNRIQRAKLIANPKQMVGSFWKEGEIMVLFAYTGTGKTAFAMQIARAISEGKSVFKDDEGNIILLNECNPKKVLYYDAELSDKQFQNRSSTNYENEYKYSDLFFMMQVNRFYNLKDEETFSESIIDSIEDKIINDKIEVVIIDNLHCLQEALENSKDAKPLMDKLVNLKHKHRISLMIIGHTPKQHLFQEMGLKDLQGSSAISVQLDTCIAIGNSVINEQTKYLKEVKIRDGEYHFGRDNVITVELYNNDKNLFEMKFICFDKEASHLKDMDSEELVETVLELSKEGKSYRDIQNETGVSKSKVGNIIKENQGMDTLSKNNSVDTKDSMDTQTQLYGT
jgi:RecA-family ATPase|tara:strand:+ start:955 stop:2049 length:1095 start_codon:yes stop_codon:yes gene_type:complete